MQISGIVCEYNPLHLGHKKQIDFLHAQGHSVVCLMSGNFVQRGHPAIFDKMTRANAALSCGADLVLELPVQYALSSAEGFAAGGVSILSKICDNICFGAENADRDTLMRVAGMLHSHEFSSYLRIYLDKGLSFPAARAEALSTMGADKTLLQTPNNILAVEYCKAILTQNSAMTPLPIHRPGSYHDECPDSENPSATALRRLLNENGPWSDFVPAAAIAHMKNAPIHSIETGEQAILYRLRTMNEEEFAALPFGSEGLWRKLMHASRSCTTLNEIIEATKSKRYTRSRIDRMILCAYLRLTEQDLLSPAPYCRVLGFRDIGRDILRGAKESGFFINVGENTRHPYQEIEQQCTALYGLFSQKWESPDTESQYRVIYCR